ncbi:MAG: glycosyltransferase family 9 protein [Nanoarchaeota archaeon]
MKRIHFDYIKQVTEIPRLFFIELFKKNKEVNAKKILIINTALIGDILVSFPAISQFIKNNKSAQIDLMVTSPIKPLAEKIRGVSKVYGTKSISNRGIETSSTLKERKNLLKTHYDLVIVLRLSKEAYNLLKKLRFKSIKTTLKSYTKYVSYISKKNTIEPVKQVKQFFFEALEEKPKNVDFEEIFNFTKKDYKNMPKMPVMAGKSKKIIIHTGSGWVLKHWDNQRWIELLKKINQLGNFNFIFIGADNQEETDFKIIQKGLNFEIYSLIRKINLRELMMIMRKSDYFIGIDSGPRNMAHLADLRSVSLLGPGPRIFMPDNKKDIVINKSNCKCTASFCLKKETCMQKIAVEDVFEGFKKLINS